MRTARTIYFIISKSHPIEFHIGGGDMSECFKEAKIYEDYYDADREISFFDEPNDYMIITGKIEANL